MNAELIDLYSSNWDKLTTSLKTLNEDAEVEIKPANPLLIHIDDEEEYRNADIRIMIYGQETNSWYENSTATIKEIQALYDSFFNEEECWKYGGQFWNGVSKFLSLLHKKFPDKKTCLIWNNIVKIGKHGDKGFPPDYIYEIEREHFHVIPQELKILNPNVVLFLTGPNYDSVIKDNFGELKYEALPKSTERELSRVYLKNIPFAYRTYHPNYLWRIGIDDYFNAIIEDINF